MPAALLRGRYGMDELFGKLWGHETAASYHKAGSATHVLDKIRVVPTGSQAGHQDVPTDPIVIESVTVLSD